jgi:hypothetical protein
MMRGMHMRWPERGLRCKGHCPVFIRYSSVG